MANKTYIRYSYWWVCCSALFYSINKPMKQCCILLFCLASGLWARADHITGGEMFYTLIGFSNGQYQYHVTAKFFKDCFINRQLSPTTYVSVFEKGSNQPSQVITAGLTRQETLNLNNNNPCITNPPQVCYEVGYYEFDISLPPSRNGFILATQVNFRINTINNLIFGYNNIGATYTAEIPRTQQIAQAPQNNSARFTASDLVVICSNNSFNYSFAAEDQDGDELRYSFAGAYMSSGGGGGNNTPPPSAPPYSEVPYGQGFTSGSPLGGFVQIDANTGLISGIAPSDGTYVVTVSVDEIRNGIVIAQQRKDLQIKITSCTIAAASILPEYQLCKESFDLNVTNASNSPLIKTYNWEITNRAGQTVYNSTNNNVQYRFTDTGLYRMKLIINKNEQCSDSMQSMVLVYPGFEADFDFAGTCITSSTRFQDASTTRYGTVNYWRWSFGESSGGGIESDRATSYQYQFTGSKTVQLITGNSVGCRDTAQKTIAIFDKPPLNLSFKDTLICVNDAVQLQASGSGVFSWSPNRQMQQSNSANPIVTPLQTTVYTVSLNDQGCTNSDSVKVNVVSAVQLQAMPDTTICAGDVITLKSNGNGLQYSWQPAENVQQPSAINTLAVTPSSTTYTITARIGGCTATDNVVVTTVPYPVANAGKDTIICYNSIAPLSGSIVGNRFEWSNTQTLVNANSLNPVAKPPGTLAYVLTAYDVLGCPKPGRDTVIVNVLPPINAFAGRDTAIVAGQPLQLNGSGGVAYQWSPAENLTAANIPNPVARFSFPSNGIQLKVRVFNEASCVDSAFIMVRVFETVPTIFVPTAFTPNGDGKNDVLRPIAAGMERIEYFNIYNRWGQLVYSSAQQEGIGWNGLIGGKEQGSGTYVWVVKAVDYTGKNYFQKGMVTLIR